jgi:hypothetical protein
MVKWLLAMVSYDGRPVPGHFLRVHELDRMVHCRHICGRSQYQATRSANARTDLVSNVHHLKHLEGGRTFHNADDLHILVRHVTVLNGNASMTGA